MERTRGNKDQYLLWKNNLKLYNSTLLIEAIKFGDVPVVHYLFEKNYVFQPEQINYVLSYLQLPVFEYLTESNFISPNQLLLNQCAYAGRCDLVCFLVEKKGLVADISTLNSLVRNGNLSDIKYFIEAFSIVPMNATIEYARLNQDIQVLEYISSTVNFQNLSTREKSIVPY